MKKILDFRHEWKIAINRGDLFALRSRLRFLMKPDPHTVDGRYRIRSLYLDSPTDRALREKIDGVNSREKFRIRYYNDDTTCIHLEKKSKRNGLCCKESVPISCDMAQAIALGRTPQLAVDLPPLLQELRYKMREQGLGPKAVVDYTREPFIYPPGNVRVTFDFDIRRGFRCADFLKSDLVTVPAGDAPVILEVKWDAFLPDVIRDAIQMPGRRSSAFSKYAQCRIYG